MTELAEKKPPASGDDQVGGLRSDYDAKYGFKVAEKYIVNFGLAEAGLTDDNLRGLAEDLIRRVGAFPDKSIISTYEAAPHLRKLPDYIVARAVEEVVASEEDAQ